jgi:hypothetical protein
MDPIYCWFQATHIGKEMNGSHLVERGKVRWIEEEQRDLILRKKSKNTSSTIIITLSIRFDLFKTPQNVKESVALIGFKHIIDDLVGNVYLALV